MSSTGGVGAASQAKPAKTQTSANTNIKDQQSQQHVAAPMIVERVNKIPMVNLAVNAGFHHYDKIRSSNVTVADVLTQAEKWAAYVWSSVQPVVDKLHDPIDKVDKLACKTLDFVEAKVPAIKKSPQEILTDSKQKYSQVMEHSALVRVYKQLIALLYGTSQSAK